MFLKLSEHIIEKTSNWEKCLLCQKEGIQNIEYHVKQHHLKRGVVCIWNGEEGYTLLCKLSCRGLSVDRKGHYHCPECNKTYSTGFTLRRHLSELHAEQQPTFEASHLQGAKSKPPQHSSEDNDNELSGKTKQSMSTKRKHSRLEQLEIPNSSAEEENLDASDFNPIEGQSNNTPTYFCDQTFEEYVEQFVRVTSCPLCTTSISTPSHLARHLENAHLNCSVWFIHNDVTYCCLPCKQNCRNYKTLMKHKAHFHCPWCKTVILQRSNFKHHVASQLENCPKTAILQERETGINHAGDNEISDNETRSDSEMVTVFIDDQEVRAMKGADGFTIPNSSISRNSQFEDSSRKRRRKNFQGSPLLCEPIDSSQQRADKMFLESLLPEMLKVAEGRKLQLKMEMLRLLHNAAYGNEGWLQSPIHDDFN